MGTTSVEKPENGVGACSSVSVGQGSNLNGFVPFPRDNAWNTDISAAPVDPASGWIIDRIARMETASGLRASGTPGTRDGAEKAVTPIAAISASS